MLNLSETKTPIDVLTSSYVQGMNVHAGMLLYVVASDIQTHIQDSHQLARATLPLLKSLLLRHCPTYVQPSLDGVHAAVVLLQMVLKVVDPELNAFLERAGLVPEMYAFPCTASEYLWRGYSFTR